jgi:hypothetical protein
MRLRSQGLTLTNRRQSADCALKVFSRAYKPAPCPAIADLIPRALRGSLAAYAAIRLAIRDRHHRIPPTPLTQDQLDVDRLVDAFVIAAQDEITISLTAAGDIIIEQHDAVGKPPDTILVRAGNVRCCRSAMAF